MQFQIAQTKQMDGIAALRGSIFRRIKLLYHGIFNNLFTLREVEVTIVEKGNHVVYTYKRYSARKA